MSDGNLLGDWADQFGAQSSRPELLDERCPSARLLVENYRVIEQDLDKGISRLEATDTVEMNPSNPCAVNPLGAGVLVASIPKSSTSGR